MKKIGTVVRAISRARLLFVIIISCLIAGTFTATALMKSKADSQAKASSVSRQDQPQRDPTAEFWQDVAKVEASPSGQATTSGQQVAVPARKFRSLILNRGAMQQALSAAPLEFTRTSQKATAHIPRARRNTSLPHSRKPVSKT